MLAYKKNNIIKDLEVRFQNICWVNSNDGLQGDFPIRT